MKKVISVVMALSMIIVCSFAFAGCSKQESLSYDVVLITNGKSIDDGGYNESAWNGVKDYAEKNNVTYRYYQPAVVNSEDENSTADTETIEKYITLAIDKGAKYIICPSEDLAVAVYETASSYPDVSFILLDAVPHSADDPTMHTVANVMCVSFDALQSGFLAGYEAVIEGNTKLGYIGQISNSTSGNYGAGFIQGAAYAADSLGVPTELTYAYLDSNSVDFDYAINVKAVYEKVSDQEEETFDVNIENGTGSGVYFDGENVTITANPAEKGKVFDHWECVSNTDGVKDKDISITSSSKETTTLVVNAASCTITAVYKDIDSDVMSLTVGDEVIGYYQEGTQVEVSAPAASTNKIFDTWQIVGNGEVENLESSTTNVKIGTEDVVLTPSYKDSEVPTFDVVVEGGTGSGSYQTGDLVTVVADEPKEGYMFSHWENTDAYGNSAGITFENEFYFDTTFEMVDRFSALAQSLYNTGVSCIYTGGNDYADSIFSATESYSYPVYAIGAGIDKKDSSGCYTSTVSDYSEAVKDALNSFTGGTVVTTGCKDNAIYLTNVGDKEDGATFDQDGYDKIYKMLADNEIVLTSAESGATLESVATNSKCLTVKAKDLLKVVE